MQTPFNRLKQPKLLLLVVLVLAAFSLGFKVAQDMAIKSADVKTAQKILDLDFNDQEIEQMLPNLNRSLGGTQELHAYELDNSTPPVLWFNPPKGSRPIPTKQEAIAWGFPENVQLPANRNDLAFYTVAELSVLIREKKISSVELTQFFIDRLKTYGDTLQSVITITEERAMAQAKRADELLAGGTYLGPLHGIPYGAKDLLAVPDYKTTWGAGPFQEQNRGEELATVVKKLDDAGAVLVAKLTLGALAMGDVWYGGTTKNPWNLEQGSSGSSAGSGSSTAAGLVPFALGTETLGSIVSPSTRNGVTGLRPTFGRVSRAGAMALSWSMDKIGPMARNAFDCALVFDAIRGEDQIDLTVEDHPFNYKGKADLSKLRVGYLKEFFDNNREGQKEKDNQVLTVLKKLGANLEPVEWVSDMPFGGMQAILTAEAAAAFDQLTRSDRDSLLVRQNAGAWPNLFRSARFTSAVDYINANRARYELVQKVNELMKEYDVIVTPSFGGSQLLTTNLTGHPCVVLKNGYNEAGSPMSISFIGNLFDEATILSVARAYQEATEFDEQHPPMFID
ncbi:Asp-tRNA(Asn)/Glu-tRNA(Gln) amidotransferase A subunit family amidase [Roseivirga pacifica]|uniref:Asp-tRNAAsn/Glu-tRNAGln amidotransferase A subunit n=1 Tax=Roseivirga pacifica TaxID=1267423 RepID=A0A1I0MDU2_9BACT|nr:amidase [Roseivirga pacifica]RKQ50319.1 Asp-tRNA(Asn)/Glu-tRNA(Gln) amidotransferase A subunit family amidase [Roseivirga pacifica]SEV86553.1 Asp-tRNAAsn/Glu-tRNAGln amidotransferase A subunit [Roseivirga pacifica]